MQSRNIKQLKYSETQKSEKLLKNNEKQADDQTLPFKELLVKVLFIGDAGVGKTSFIQRYISNKFHDNYKWTVGVDFAIKNISWSERTNIKLQMWDVAGQERFSKLTRVYYRDAQACVVMFDLARRDTFLGARRWMLDLETKCTELENNKFIPCLLLANKCDLSERQVYQEEIESFCKEHDFIGWTEASVKEGLMVEDAMKYVIDEVMIRCGESDDIKLTSCKGIQLMNTAAKVKEKSCPC